MPGGRTRYNPGLPGGGRTRYVGEDAYANQQRENETRATTPPTGRFCAQVWTNQTAPGALGYWFADFAVNPVTGAPPTSNNLDEFSPSNWEGVTLERFTFVVNSITYQGYMPVLQPGWWSLQMQAHIERVGSTYFTGRAILYPTRLLRSSQNFTGRLSRDEIIDVPLPYGGVGRGFCKGAKTLPVTEESVLMLWYASDGVANPTLLASTPNPNWYNDSYTYLSGFRLP